MVSTVTNISGQNQKVDSTSPKPPSAHQANTQTSMTGNEQGKTMAAMTLAEPSQQGPQTEAAVNSADASVKDEKALEATPKVPEPVRSAYHQGEQKVGTYVDKIV